MKKIRLYSYYFPIAIGILISILILPKDSWSQNVGIGISNPTRATLEVHGAVGTTAAIFGGESTGISLQRNWPSVGFNQYYNGVSKYISNGFAAVQYLDPTNGYMTLDMFPDGVTDATAPSLNRALVIGYNGNIGIKTNPVNASLYVIKGGNSDGSAIFGGTDFSSYFHYSVTEDTYIRAGKSGGNVYINDLPNGKIIMGSGTSYVGINTTTPAYPLEIRQTGATGLILVEPAETFNNWEQVVGLYDGGPQSSLKFIYNGQLKTFIRPTDGELIASSDKRLKTNILPLISILHKIIQLRPVCYEMKYNNPDHEKTIGFIAQEVKQIFPEMVTVSPNTVAKGVTIPDFHGLNYNSFKILAVKAVQEEQVLIQDLQSRQTEIARRLEALERKLSIKN
jgi:hypothetical protein